MSRSDDDSILHQLDWKSQTILQTLYKLGGEATTSEIRQRTTMETNDPITYRFRRAETALEPNGLIEIDDPATSVSDLNTPLTATLTAAGEEVAEQLIESGRETSSLDARVESIEARLDALERESNDHPQEIENQLATLNKRIERLTTDEFGAWAASEQREFQTMKRTLDAVCESLGITYDQAGEQAIHDDRTS